MPEFEGEGRNVLCNRFSVCSRSMNSSQCLSLPIINSLSSTICKADVLEPLVLDVYSSINAIFSSGMSLLIHAGPSTLGVPHAPVK